MYLVAGVPTCIAMVVLFFILFVMMADGGLNEILPLVYLAVILFAMSFIIQCYYAIANGDRSIFEK